MSLIKIVLDIRVESAQIKQIPRMKFTKLFTVYFQNTCNMKIQKSWRIPPQVALFTIEMFC